MKTTTSVLEYIIVFIVIYFLCAFLKWDINLFDDISSKIEYRVSCLIILFFVLYLYNDIKTVTKY